MASTLGCADRRSAAAVTPLFWSQSVGALPTILIPDEPRPCSMPFTRSSSAGTPGTPCRTAIVAPCLSCLARNWPASTPPLRLSVATTEDFLLQSGRSLSMSTTFTPLATAASSAGITAGVVGGRVANADRDRGARGRGIPLLRRGLHRQIEVDRELHDEAELHRLLAGGRRCGGLPARVCAAVVSAAARSERGGKRDPPPDPGGPSSP